MGHCGPAGKVLGHPGVWYLSGLFAWWGRELEVGKEGVGRFCFFILPLFVLGSCLVSGFGFCGPVSNKI